MFESPSNQPERPPRFVVCNTDLPEVPQPPGWASALQLRHYMDGIETAWNSRLPHVCSRCALNGGRLTDWLCLGARYGLALGSATPVGWHAIFSRCGIRSRESCWICLINSATSRGSCLEVKRVPFLLAHTHEEADGMPAYTWSVAGLLFVRQLLAEQAAETRGLRARVGQRLCPKSRASA